jgi:hypothetical protein
MKRVKPNRASTPNESNSSKNDELVEPEARTTADEFVVEITAEWDQIDVGRRLSVEAIIKTGNKLIEAKAALDHGKWGKLFEEGPLFHTDERELDKPKLLPFGQRTAERLMRIAENPFLSNPTHVSILPPSWGTLDALAGLPIE